jgi:hypothetical protein
LIGDWEKSGAEPSLKQANRAFGFLVLLTGVRVPAEAIEKDRLIEKFHCKCATPKDSLLPADVGFSKVSKHFRSLDTFWALFRAFLYLRDLMPQGVEERGKLV